MEKEVYPESPDARSGVDRIARPRHGPMTEKCSVARARSEEKKAEPEANAAPPRARRPRRVVRTLFALLFIASPLAIAAVMAAQAPQFYLDRVDAGDEKKLEDLANQFLSRGSRLYNSIVTGSNSWKESFDEASINAWLAYDLKRNHQRALPREVTAPRVALEDESLRVGFRWGYGPATTVVQVALKTWVPQENRLAVELQGASAGALPLPTSYVRRIIESVAGRNGCEVRWKRHGANLVALIDLPKGNRGVKLRCAEVSNGVVTLSGRTTISISVSKEPKTTR